LHQAKLNASNAADREALDHVLSLLVMLSGIKEPPDLSEAEEYCLERERVIGTGYVKAQYAMTLYWTIDDPARTVTKAREAIAASRNEDDDKSVYQSFGLLGLALLDLRKHDESIAVLNEIQKMVAARRRIVVGDETLFLEKLRAETTDEKTIATIQEIAGTLSPVCVASQIFCRSLRPNIFSAFQQGQLCS
jgi:hypothetical protein